MLAANGDGLTHEFEIFLERLPPPPPFPGDGPAGHAGVHAGDGLGDHLRLLDGPFGHRLTAPLVLGYDSLEHDQPNPRKGSLFDLGAVQRELPRCLCPGISEGHSGVGCRHIEAVGLEEKAIELRRQALTNKAVMVATNLSTECLGNIRRRRQEVGAALCSYGA